MKRGVSALHELLARLKVIRDGIRANFFRADAFLSRPIFTVHVVNKAGHSVTYYIA